jgi:hypothetical protein
MVVALVSRWARRYVAFAVCCLGGAHAVAALDGPTDAMVALALYGFVFHVVFGKAYSLVPSYFEVDLAAPGAVRAVLGLTGVGALAMAAEPFGRVPAMVGSLGALSWASGAVLFAGVIGASIRSNPTGAETGTSPGKAHLAGLDRVANAFVPVAFAYLLAGAYATLVAHDVAPAVGTGVVAVFDGYPPRATHLLGAGTAALLVFALGSRLFPRFLVVDPPRWAFGTALVAGAVGPVLLAATLPAGEWFPVAAAVEAVALSAYAVGFGICFARSDRGRVAFWGVLAGAGFALVATALGVWLAIDGVSVAVLAAHRYVTLLGFLGLTIVGVTLQFYPPAVGQWRWCSNRTGAVALGLLAGGVALATAGLTFELALVETVGEVVAFGGVLVYGYVLAGAFATR